MTDVDLELVARQALAARFPARSGVQLQPAGWSASRRSRSVLASTAAVLVIVAIALGVVLWPRNTHEGVGDGLSSATQSRVVRLVHRFEHMAGGGKVARVEVAQSTRGHAVRVITTGDEVEGNERVVVIELTAATVFHAITTGPPGANTNPTVKYQILVVNARTFQSTDGSISNRHVDLSGLGTVTSFKP